MSMQEQTLAQIVARRNDDVACRCQVYTGADTCSCEQPEEPAKKPGCPKCGRIGLCDDCCCVSPAHRSKNPHDTCSLCNHGGTT